MAYAQILMSEALFGFRSISADVRTISLCRIRTAEKASSHAARCNVVVGRIIDTILIIYNCAITDPDDGKVYTNYKAVNVLGLIAAADMDNSSATVHPIGPPLIDVDGLVMDENKTYGAVLCRLAESSNAVLVHKSVKKHIESLGYEDVSFYEADEVALWKNIIKRKTGAGKAQ